MAEVKWIKLSTEMFENEKIDFIESLPDADAVIVIWVRLLAMAGKCNANGYILLTENIPYTDEMLAHKFRKPLNVVKFALETLKKLNMIQINEDGMLYISNWEKHQNIEGMEKIKEQNRLRKQKQRENQKLLSEKSDVTKMSRDSHTTITQQNKSKNKDKDIDIDIDKELVVEVEEKNKKEKIENEKSSATADTQNELNNLPCERDLPPIEDTTPKAFIFYEENFCKPKGKICVPKSIADNLIEAIGAMGDELVLLALEKTLEMGGDRDWAYAKKILAEWYKKGISSKEQALTEKRASNKQKTNNKSSTLDILANMYKECEEENPSE